LRNKGIFVEEPDRQIGGNSKIFRFSLDNEKYLLKVYVGDKERIHRSRQRELKALEFLRENGFFQVPKANVELSPPDGVCMNFLKGKNPKSSKRTNRAILKSFRDLKEIYDESPNFGNAIDSSFSTLDVVNQVELRLQNINLWNSNHIQIALESLKSVESIRFPERSLTYSFSDIGGHNMIVNFGKFYFIDLEFFGRDSAVKMIVDYILHPKNIHSVYDVEKCIRTAESLFGISKELLFKSTPFFAAKWATIVAKRLSEGMPEALKLDSIQKFNNYLDLASTRDEESISRKLLNLR
jgi:hypothetical protein